MPELGALAAAMPERLALMVTLASWCALRFGELVELRRGDVDLSAEVVRIRRAAVRTSEGYTTTTPKSDAGTRDVDIPPHIIPLIETHLAKYVGVERGSLLFGAEGGGHLQPSTLYRHWYRARAAAGRPDLRFHDLRHSGAYGPGATLDVPDHVAKRWATPSRPEKTRAEKADMNLHRRLWRRRAETETPFRGPFLDVSSGARHLRPCANVCVTRAVDR